MPAFTFGSRGTNTVFQNGATTQAYHPYTYPVREETKGSPAKNIAKTVMSNVSAIFSSSSLLLVFSSNTPKAAASARRALARYTVWLTVSDHVASRQVKNSLTTTASVVAGGINNMTAGVAKGVYGTAECIRDINDSEGFTTFKNSK